jgi:hypothetical protein
MFLSKLLSKNKTLSAVTQAGLVNNLNDGMIWDYCQSFYSQCIIIQQILEL